MLHSHVEAPMSTNPVPLSLPALLMAGTAVADVPRVAVDIAPLHSLVARVMEGVGAPDLVIPAAASPHEHSLRPSEAAALQAADLVFWIGEDLTPWLGDAVETLASDATVTSLLAAPETELLAFREGALFEAHDHGDEDNAGHDDHAYDDHGHDDQAHDDQADDAAADQDDHDHGARDPHAWLSPANAAAWLTPIAAALSAADPANASAYFANAAAAGEEMEALRAEVDRMLEPVRGGRFVVFHDAYQYFETAFDMPAAGAISLGDAADPSPARIDEIQGRIREEGVACVLAEPQFDPAIVETVLDGVEAEAAVIDPVGADLEPGPGLYPALIRGMARTLADCL
jgi:zinc transport system substrate-binding protein